MKKKLIAALLSILMLFSLLPTTALAAAGDQTLKGSIYKLESFSEGSTAKYNFESIVTSSHKVPQTEAVEWVFCPNGSSKTVGKIFTKVDDSTYYYLGVSGGKLALIKGTGTDPEKESHGSYKKGSGAPTGALEFTIGELNETTGECTLSCKSGSTTYYVTGKADELTTTKTKIFLRGNSGEVYMQGFDQVNNSGVVSGTAIQTYEQRDIYIVNSAKTGALGLDVEDGAKLTAAPYSDTVKVDKYYGLPADPDEIATPLAYDNDVLINLGNAEVWAFSGSRSSFTLTLTSGSGTSTKVTSDTSGSGYHNWMLKLGSGTNWQVIPKSAATGANSVDAVKLASDAEGNGFTFNKHDTNRFGFGSTTNTKVYNTIGIYKGYSETANVSNYSGKEDGSVHLPGVTITSAKTNFTPVIKYSMDGKNWYTSTNATADKDFPKTEGTYSVYVGMFYQGQSGTQYLLNKVSATVTLTQGDKTITFNKPGTNGPTKEEKQAPYGKTLKVIYAPNGTMTKPAGWTQIENGYSTTITGDITVSDPTANTGWKFLGWEYEKDNNDNVTLTAKYDPIITYPGPYPDFEPQETPIANGKKLTLVLDGGTFSQTISTAMTGTQGKWTHDGDTYYKTITAPENVMNYKPTKSGWQFNGWGTPVTDKDGNITLTAQYIPKVIYPTELPIQTGKTLTLKLDGGAFDVTTKTTMLGDDWVEGTDSFSKTITEPEDVSGYEPAKDDWVFIGWGDPKTDAQGNVTLTAQYNPDVTYPGPYPDFEPQQTPITKGKKLTLVLNGGAFDTTTATAMTSAQGKWTKSNDTYYKTINTPEDVSNYMPTKSGWQFNGWGTPEVDGQGNVTLKAQYIPKVIYPTELPIQSGKTLTLILNGGAFDTATKTTMLGDDWVEGTGSFSKTITAPEDVTNYKPTKDNSEFDCWDNPQIDAQGNVTLTAKYVAGEPINFNGPGPQGPQPETEYGKHGKTLTVIYGPNGSLDNPGQWTEVTNGYSTTLNGPISVDDPTADEGYEFTGWKYEVDADGNVTLTAQYDVILTYPGPADGPDSYVPETTPIKPGTRVALDLTGGEFLPEDETELGEKGWNEDGEQFYKVMNEPENLMKYRPEKPGFYFNGWDDPVEDQDHPGGVILKALWLEDNDDNDVPDDYEVPVQFSVVGNTWKDLTSADKTVKVALFENGKWSAAGTGYLSADQIPAGLSGKSGEWDQTVSTTTPLTKDANPLTDDTYYYTYYYLQTVTYVPYGATFEIPVVGAQTGNYVTTVRYGALADNIDEAGTAVTIEKSGYMFAGWYQDKDMTISWNFDTPVTKDMTLHAKWVSNTFDVSVSATVDGQAPQTALAVSLTRGEEEEQTGSINGAPCVFEDVAAGSYNVVVTAASGSMTVVAEVNADNAVDGVVYVSVNVISGFQTEVKKGNENTKQEVIDKTRDTSADLKDLLEEEPFQKKGTEAGVKVALESTHVEPGVSSGDSELDARASIGMDKINQISGLVTSNIEYIDVVLRRTGLDAAGQPIVNDNELIPDAKRLVQFTVQFPTAGKDIFVYVYHTGKAAADTLVKVDSLDQLGDGNYFVGADSITICSQYFSIYAISWVNHVTPTPGPMPAPEEYTVHAPAYTRRGQVTISAETAPEDETITITTKPDYGYYLNKLTVTAANGTAIELVSEGNGVYTFTMPAQDVYVDIGFTCLRDETCPIDPFTDTQNNYWWHDGVHYCIEKGYMNGFPGLVFQPNGNTTRAQIVTILWRIAGKPVANYAMSFEDVEEDQWYTEAIRWAQSTGVVLGFDELHFGPNQAITREQLAAILYRFAKYQGIDVTKGENANLAGYTDFASVTAYAIPALKWSTTVGIVKGDDAKTLRPTALSTRAESANMIQRYCEDILELHELGFDK